MTEVKARAESVSMETFATVYSTVQKRGGTIADVMKEANIANIQTANQKLVKLRAAYESVSGKELPALTRRTRTANASKGTAAGRAAQLLAEAFGETVASEA